MHALSGIRAVKGAKKADNKSTRLTGSSMKKIIKYVANGRVIKPTQPPRVGSDWTRGIKYPINLNDHAFAPLTEPNLIT